MTEKQYENLMSAISMLLAAIVDARPPLPTGKPRDSMKFLTGLFSGGAKEIYDFLTANSFDGDYETLKKKMLEERQKKEREEREKLAKEVQAINRGVKYGTAV
jgi:hypothetical protein